MIGYLSTLLDYLSKYLATCSSAHYRTVTKMTGKKLKTANNGSYPHLVCSLSNNVKLMLNLLYCMACMQLNFVVQDSISCGTSPTIDSKNL